LETKKTASIANIKPVIAAPAMAAATWLLPTLVDVLPPPPLDALVLASWDDDAEPGTLLLDITVTPGAVDTNPGGGSAPGGLLFDDTGTGIMTSDWFVSGAGDAEEEDGGGLRGEFEGWEFD
jgi:hypothetical protein